MVIGATPPWLGGVGAALLPPLPAPPLPPLLWRPIPPSLVPHPTVVMDPRTDIRRPNPAMTRIVTAASLVSGTIRCRPVTAGADAHPMVAGNSDAPLYSAALSSEDSYFNARRVEL